MDNGVNTAGDDGWIVRIAVGGRGVSRSGTVVLNYKNATVQRAIATDADDTDPPLEIQAFSGTVDSADGVVPNLDSIPQFPVKELVKDIITVKRAADGSGTVTFELDGDDVTGGSAGGNSAMSIPAGLTKDDVRNLIVKYTPEGDMGAGQFEVRLPSLWAAEDVLTSGDEKTTKTGDPVHTILLDFPEHFGEAEESVEITLVDVTVPNSHGDHGFLSKSKGEGGSLKQLTRPVAFVGNAEADNDTVKVEIDPAAAYQNQDNVDFEITITANGPMHDSEIQIIVPDGLTDLQIGTASDPNYVRKISASVSGVDVTVEDSVILITTGKLNPGGRIKVRFDNVDLADVDAEGQGEGFRVETRTRTDVAPVVPVVGDPPTPTLNLADEGFEPIVNADGDRSIVGGLIRTVAGSGTMAVEPATIEQSSRNKNIKLTFTATTDFENLVLKIEAPSVIETELHEGSSSDDGYVSTSTSKFHADTEADDRLADFGLPHYLDRCDSRQR